MIGWFLRLFRCSHRSGFYRERRIVHGVNLMHWVCLDDCGHAVPVIARTKAEHKRVRQQGAIQLPRAQRQEPQKIRRIG